MLSSYPTEGVDFWVWRFPLARGFALWTAGQARLGIEPSGPTYAQREILAAIRAAAPPAAP